MAGGVPGCLYASLEIVISPACRMVGRFRGCEHSVTATIKHIAGKCENGFDKFPGVSFMSSNVPPYSRNIDKKTEVKTN